MLGKSSTIEEKLDIARKELLDLGLRNPLLNYRTLKARGLEVTNKDPIDVYETLVSESAKMSFQDLSTSELTSEEGNLLAETKMEKENIDKKGIKKSKTKLQTNYTEKVLEKRLLNTYYFARTYIEEQGVNILYMALGMLHWYESNNSQEVRKAPLLLVPVQLDRISAKERFTISYTEEEIGHNISLVAKMKADFGIDIPSLSIEDEDVDIHGYFTKVAKSIEGQKNWSVHTDSIVIGFFSFGKFLMYRDLDPSIWPDHLRPEEHTIISALLKDGFNEENSEIGEDEHIDQYVNLNDSNLIMDADSSQTLAILDANKGRNLVIQGPPGTGKSQTITNLIAEAIGNGKKVLFVSEKMAALEVVKRRLDSVGLGVACLELHSHKTNKKALLHELASTLDLGKPKYSNGDIATLEELRSRLNDYCNAVNEAIGTSGVTPFQALGALTLAQTKHKEIKFPKVNVEDMENWSADEYRKKENIMEELQKVIHSMGSPSKHPFWGSKKKVILPTEIDLLVENCNSTLDNVAASIEKIQLYKNELDYEQVTNIGESTKFLETLKRVISAPDLTNVIIESKDWLHKRDNFVELFDNVEAYTKLLQKYDAILLPETWKQDWLETRQHLVQYKDKWWKFLSSDYRKSKSRVIGFFHNPKEAKVDLLEVVDSIMEGQRLKQYIEENEAIAKELFQDRWNTNYEEWENLRVISEWLMKLHKDIQDNTISQLVIEYLKGKIENNKFEEIIVEVEKVITKTKFTLDSLEKEIEFDSDIRFQNQEGLANQDYNILQDIIGVWSAKGKELQEMASYNIVKERCIEQNLSSFSKLAESWEHAGDFLIELFRWSWNEVLLTKAFKERQALAHFEGTRHEHVRQKFQDLDRLLIEVNRFKLAEEHWNYLPQYDGPGQLGVLRREFEKKSRHLPIRQLMLRAGNAIQAIKPIFMMGPLSISTYIEPGSMEFDLVIFDEASQVKPVDAFGAIIRAKQAVVVGDSKQMPPTNFFDSITKDEEENEDYFVGDMESILGLFVGQGAPQRMLRWHYRSRHESLITVSNYEFYENKLVAFPSPDANMSQSGLKYNYSAETYYDRGKSRTNREEAKQVALAVMEHAKRHANQTLGVAAFSMAQMQAILDEIELLRRTNIELESFFSAHPHEPFFVKNLENVQGDERDVIFISIGYGKTKEGYLAMDFGALNRDGGERRLNVLITRARIRCEVFTNLRSDDIDLKRSNAYGVKSLKTFLKYAETGYLDVPTVTGKGFDSPFEKAVYQSLVNLGYILEPQVGSGGFYIDLAIVDPDLPGRYLLGIECDGATYHSARSARDRDRLRQEVLEGLGWNIHRIWSTDWFRHPERELKRVVEAIEKAKVSSKVNIDPINTPRKEQKREQKISRDDSVEKTVGTVKQYELAQLDISLEDVDFQSLLPEDLSKFVSEVVRVESPVHVSEVMKRICNAFGIKRVGSRIQRSFDEVFLQYLSEEITKKGEFLWLNEMNVPLVRVREGAIRKVELIPQEEYEEAITDIVGMAFGVKEENLAHLVYQTLGFSRVTEEMKEHLSSIVVLMVEENKLVDKNGELNVSNNQSLTS